MGLPPVNLDELLRYYGGPVHHAELSALKSALSEAQKENERLRRDHMAHFCQDGHTPIRHNDSDYEPEELSCPVCRERNEIATLRAKARIADEIMAWCATEHNVTLDSAYWRERYADQQPAPDARGGAE